MSSIERRPAGTLDTEERQFEILMRHARLYAKVPGLKAEIKDNPEAVAGIMLSLQSYGLAVTLPAINMAFDWIQDRAEPSAMFYQAVAMHNGYRIHPRIRTAELAVAVISCPSDPYDEPAQVSYTLAEAIASHRLDAWAERWRTVKAKAKNGNYYDRNIKDTFVVRVNGEPTTWNGDLQVPLPDPLPEWVVEQIDLLQVRRYDAWWNYRSDMMWKSAAKRAVKVACPHVLLGGGDFDHSPSGQIRDGGFEADDPDIVDVEAIDEDPA